jgi:hypothetical protein
MVGYMNLIVQSLLSLVMVGKIENLLLVMHTYVSNFLKLPLEFTKLVETIKIKALRKKINIKNMLDQHLGTLQQGGSCC